MTGRADALARAYAPARRWLVEDALPLWAERGVDRALGGFFEAIGQDGVAVAAPRRARVVARQTYVFEVARRMGWIEDAAVLVRHGLDALVGRCIRAAGLTLSRYDAGGGVVAEGFDLYDHAFVLLALATVAQDPALADEAQARAGRMLSAMEAFRHPLGGWRNATWPAEGLRADPHMHMLETALAFDALPDRDPRWREVADDLVALALDRLVDPDSGALLEYFGADWDTPRDRALRVIEPGHQFEWAWLLRGWNSRVGDARVEAAAARLHEIGEGRGVNAGGIVVDSLWDDLSVCRPALRLWAQTERIKISVQAPDRSGETAAIEALGAMQAFFDTPVAGLWNDRLEADGSPVIAPAPASSLYHIVAAMEACERAIAAQGLLQEG